ncbi:hypothetical protein PAXRUDRAFT_27947 [Paxillus rubicundulus Ve08.2h10]|uniref:Uncharacterized protein n=1 Tax=Paxillus rubicundulus Ve08.2h10 TaxID=930991 RepID=A0A0D0DPX5_9AGAM|nr:hypothetical protein PAXRUDRAFT_27947 [Paxillus rubicundulus Ve08.2h10]
MYQQEYEEEIEEGESDLDIDERSSWRCWMMLILARGLQRWLRGKMRRILIGFQEFCDSSTSNFKEIARNDELGKVEEAGNVDLEEIEDWEDELHEATAPATKICDWETLWRNLNCCKLGDCTPMALWYWKWGVVCKIFEQLPVEKWGGSANGQSLLQNESILQNHARTWLLNLKTGEVTPCALQKVLNSTIFPDLGINPKWPICKCTTQ